MLKYFLVLLACFPVITLASGIDFSFKPGLLGWNSHGKHLSFDTVCKKSRLGSLKLTSNGTHQSAVKYFSLTPDTEYEISFFIKADNVKGATNTGIKLGLFDGRKNITLYGNALNQPKQGTFDWTKCVYSFKSSFFRKNEVRLILILSCKGTVWLDDLKVTAKKGKSTIAQQPIDPMDFSFRKGLPGWWESGRNSSADPVCKISDSCSLKLTYSGEVSSVSRTVKLEPDTEYEVSVYVKGENVRGKKYTGALLRLTDGERHWAVTADAQKNIAVQGTFDWTKCVRSINSSQFKNNMVTVMPLLSCAGTVWFDDLKIVKKSNSPTGNFRKQYGNAIKSVWLVPRGIFGFFDSDQKVTFDFLIKRPVKNLEYTLQVRNESGKEVYRSSRKKLEKTFSIPGQKIGYYVVDVEIFANGQKAYFIQSAFAVNTPIKKLDPFFQFGYGVIGKMLPGLKRIGCGAIVAKYHFEQPKPLLANPEKTVANFLKTCQPYLNDKDVKVVIDVTGKLTRRNRTESEFKAGYPLVSDAMLNNLVTTVGMIHQKTRNRVREWSTSCEIPSQAIGDRSTNCGTWTEAMFNFMTISRMVSRKLKSSDPSLKFYCGGNNRQDFTDSIERIVMGDLINDFDEYFIDGYTGNWNMTLGQYSIPEQHLMNFYNTASKLSISLGKGKYIRNHETGYAINYGARFDSAIALEQAYLTARTIIISKAAPVKCFELHKPSTLFLKDLQNNDICMTTCWKPLREGSNFHHIPLPGGSMYAMAAKQLSYAEFLANVNNGNVFCYLFKKLDGSTLITLWNKAEDQQFFCKFPSDAKGFNMFGRKISVKDPIIGKAPIYITTKMSPQNAITLMKNAVNKNSPEFQCEAVSDKIFIRSYASNTKVCKLIFPGQSDKEIKLLPGKINEVSINVTDNGKLLAPDGRLYPITLKRQDIHSIKRLKNRPLFDGSGKWLSEISGQLLKYPDHIRPAEALQPERKYFKSSFNPNGHNISAQYWTAYDDQYFYFAVKVDDPIHQQRYSGTGIWRDDCVQFVLSDKTAGSSQLGKSKNSENNFGFALTSKGPQLVKYFGKDKGIKDYYANVTRKANKTFYEVAVPWKEIGGKAKTFGFVVYNNNWKTAKSAPYYLEFSPGVTTPMDDSKLKILKYVE